MTSSPTPPPKNPGSQHADGIVLHSIQTVTCGRLLQAEGDQAAGVEPANCGPSVGPVTGVAGDALLACDRVDDRDEPVVAGAVHGRCKAQAHGVHAAVDKLERKVLASAAASPGRGTGTRRPRRRAYPEPGLVNRLRAATRPQQASWPDAHAHWPSGMKLPRPQGAPRR
jgi:hypothetical protein